MQWQSEEFLWSLSLLGKFWFGSPERVPQDLPQRSQFGPQNQFPRPIRAASLGGAATGPLCHPALGAAKCSGAATPSAPGAPAAVRCRSRCRRTTGLAPHRPLCLPPRRSATPHHPPGLRLRCGAIQALNCAMAAAPASGVPDSGAHSAAAGAAAVSAGSRAISAAGGADSAMDTADAAVTTGAMTSPEKLWSGANGAITLGGAWRRGAWRRPAQRIGAAWHRR